MPFTCCLLCFQSSRTHRYDYPLWRCITLSDYLIDQCETLFRQTLQHFWLLDLNSLWQNCNGFLVFGNVWKPIFGRILLEECLLSEAVIYVYFHNNFLWLPRSAVILLSLLQMTGSDQNLQHKFKKQNLTNLIRRIYCVGKGDLQ